jgi:uncharacterized protein
MASILDSNAFNENLFFPRKDYEQAPLGATDFMVQADGAELHVRFHASTQNAATVLLFHGNGEVVSDYDETAKNYAACGANLAVADFRGYGKSTGTPTLRSLVLDADTVLEALKARGVGTLFVMGRSIGAVCAAALYAKQDPAITGFMWESGVVDLNGLVHRRGLDVPARWTEKELQTFDARTKLRAGNQPMLMIHGERDATITVAEARSAYDALSTRNKTFELIAGRGHNDLSHEASYWDAIAAFVKRYTKL